MADRQHQTALRERVALVDSSDLPIRILVWAVPGGGKSRLPGILADRFKSHKIGWFVPRLSLQHQAVVGLEQDFGITLRDSGNEPDPSRGTRGFVATHQALLMQPELWRHELRKHRYVLVIDEHHHAKRDKKDVLTPLANAVSQLRADVTLYMTGTLDTNDGQLIYGMHYDQVPKGFEINPEKSANIYIRYSRQAALSEGAIIPIEFHHHDGPVTWKKGTCETPITRRLSEVSREEESAAIFTSMRSDVAQILFGNGVQHWRDKSSGKLIVVVDSQENARRYSKSLTAQGIPNALAINDNDSAHEEIKAFKRDRPALVTCQMAYEGLDVPEASHVICLTHIRSVPWIEQMLGRVWRAHPSKKGCWAFVPDDPRMNRVIEKIYRETPQMVYGPAPSNGGNPSHVEDVLAIDGIVDAVRQKYLDGEYEKDEVQDRFVELVKQLGLTGTEPEVVRAIEAVKEAISNKVPKHHTTVAEREQSLRSQLAKTCRRKDYERADRLGREPKFGETQKMLFERTKKSITAMTEKELMRAHSILESIRS